MRLLYSIKEVQKSEDLDAFYNNLKYLVKESSHALIVFAGFLAALSLVCASYGASIAAGGAAVLTAIEAATVGTASPFVAAALVGGAAILAFFETMCLFLAGAAGATAGAGAGAKIVGFLINKVSKMDPEAEVKKQDVVEEPAVEQITGPAAGEEDKDLESAGDVSLVAESFNMARWHTLAGVLK